MRDGVGGNCRLRSLGAVRTEKLSVEVPFFIKVFVAQKIEILIVV